jgi:hypothetical protein
MARDVMVETRRDRAELAADAGWGRISFLSVLTGTLVAFGAFAVLAALTAAVLAALNVDTDLSTNEWRQAGFAAAALMAVLQFASYFWGGYTAGRMARRGGAMNGFLVFVVGLLVAGGVAALANAFADTDEVARNLRSVGIPTTGDEWRDVGAVAAGAALLAMVLGSVLGGIKGERWHGKLLARAWDPEVGDGVPVAPASQHLYGGDDDRRFDLRDDDRGARIVDDGTSTSVFSSRRDTDDDADNRRVLDRDTTLDEDYAERGRRVSTD